MNCFAPDRTAVRRGRPRLPLIALVVLAFAGVVVGVGGASTARSTASPPLNTAPPTVTGSAQQAQTLVATTGSWSGDAPISYMFRWQRCSSSGGSCSDISGATGQSYVVTSSDVGASLRVVVTASNAVGSATAASSPTGSVVPPGTKPSPTAQPNPHGTAQVGQTVTVDNGSWSGTTPMTFGYQWQRCSPTGTCTDISGATKFSYVPAASDVGLRLRALVTATNSVGSASAASNLTAPVLAGTGAPVNTAAPTIAAPSTAVGDTVTGWAGTWSGVQPISYSLAWRRCNSSGGNCQTIAGAVTSTYALTTADDGSTIELAVTASNAIGSTIAFSAPTTLVTTGPLGAIRLVGGKVSIPVTSVSLPDRLVISRVAFSPSPVRSRAPFQGRFLVTDTRGYVVRGALVYAVGLPYGWVANATEVTTGSDGYATVEFRPTLKLPLARGSALVVFLRARRPGENILAGVSNRRLVQVRLAPPLG
jgi:hypothetical protein